MEIAWLAICKHLSEHISHVTMPILAINGLTNHGT